MTAKTAVSKSILQKKNGSINFHVPCVENMSMMILQARSACNVLICGLDGIMIVLFHDFQSAEIVRVLV
jgi:hypothetical protein